MKHTVSLIAILAILLATIFTGHAQAPVTLQFTGQDQYGQHVPLSTVTVENVTQHWQEMLYYPDTTLFIGQTGIEEIEQFSDGVRLFQNVPNPFDGVTDFVLYLPEASAILLEICDMNGIVTATYSCSLDPGSHRFRSWLASPQTYLLNARTDGGTIQIKMVNAGHARQNRLEYLGKGSISPMEKAGGDEKGSTDLPFNYGDIMSYIGYAHIANTEFTSATETKEQYNSELLPLTFTLPLPTVTTEAATNITPTEARLNGSVVEAPNFPVSERGFLLTDNDQLIGATDYEGGAGGGSFHSDANGLQMGTRYYYRAYAKTILGTTLGDMLYFDTQSDLPEVYTLMVTNTSFFWADCGGNVTYDGGSAVTARGVCWNTEQNPTVNNSHTTDGNGTGSFTSHIVGLNANTTYYVRAYATNSVGTAYGEEVSFTTEDIAISANDAQPCPGTPTVTDHEGNVYNTVQIGNQCWTKENLRTTTSPSTGTYLFLHNNNALTFTGKQAHWCNNDSATYAPMNYGLLYNWNAAVDTFNPAYGEMSVDDYFLVAASVSFTGHRRGICPMGWHLPNKLEWMTLINYLSSHPEYSCDGNSSNFAKTLASTTGWYSSNNSCDVGYNQNANNTLNFGAVPAGYYYIFHDFYLIGQEAAFWSSTEVANNSGIGINYCGAYSPRLNHNSPNVTQENSTKSAGQSVRCLRD